MPRANYAVVGQLGRIGNLLNQALRQVNAGHLAPEVRPLILTTYAMLAAVRHDLLRQSGTMVGNIQRGDEIASLERW